jgi:GH25 family lysozyme M1 (1,4-beta-N-acetylmuramidase)
MITGIDVSKYQVEIDWEHALRQGISFAFIRSSEGNKQTDSFFDRNMQETSRLGIPRGIYHYFKPGKDWKAQRDLFGELIHEYPFELEAVVDVETDDGLSKNDTNNALSKFCKGLEETYISNGLMIYTSPGFFDSQLPLTDYAWRYRLWVAHWTTNKKPLLPKEWSNHKKTWSFWQYDAKGNGLGSQYGVPSGGSNDICLDRYNGDASKFMAYYNLTSLPSLPPDPPPPPPDPVSSDLVFEITAMYSPLYNGPDITSGLVKELSFGETINVQDIHGTDEVWVMNEEGYWSLLAYNGRLLMRKKSV